MFQIQILNSVLWFSVRVGLGVSMAFEMFLLVSDFSFLFFFSYLQWSVNIDSSVFIFVRFQVLDFPCENLVNKL